MGSPVHASLWRKEISMRFQDSGCDNLIHCQATLMRRSIWRCVWDLALQLRTVEMNVVDGTTVLHWSAAQLSGSRAHGPTWCITTFVETQWPVLFLCKERSQCRTSHPHCLTLSLTTAVSEERAIIDHLKSLQPTQPYICKGKKSKWWVLNGSYLRK